MGFFGSESVNKSSNLRSTSTALLNRNGCKLCPLDREPLYHPKMNATGSLTPIVYMLGEAPGVEEDQIGEQFVGASGRLLRPLLPKEYENKVRWNNVLNCHPKNNKDPEPVEIECCRGRIVSDIEQTKPKVIFGFGNFALSWCLNQTGISKWRGRRIPVKIGSHCTWFYPFYHPAALARYRKGRNRDIISEDERATQFDLKRAFAEVPNLKSPQVHSKDRAREGIDCRWGSSPKDLAAVLGFLDRACKAPYAGVDYETNVLRPYAADACILSASVSLSEQETMAFALRHPGARWSRSDLQKIKEAWCQFLQSPCRKLSHGLHFELEWTGVTFGREMVRASPWEDSVSQAATLDERTGQSKPGCFGLGFLSLQLFGLDIKQLSHLDRKNMINEPIEEILPYNGMDSKYHLLVWEELDDRLYNEGLMDQYLNRLRRVPTAVLTQMKGVPIDIEENKRLSKEYGRRLQEIETKIQALPEVATYYKYKRKPFEPSKNVEVMYVLKEIIKVNPELLADAKNYEDDEAETTSKDNLKKIGHPFADLIIDFRNVAKMKSTYIDSIDKYLWADKQIHQQLETNYVETTRSSSNNPNTQNYPSRDAEDKHLRGQVRARFGEVFVAADSGQIQFRNIAMESKDPVLCRYIWEGHDVHMEWAEKIAYAYPSAIGGKPFIKDPDVMKKFRHAVKNQFVFPSCFGAKRSSVAGYLGIPEEYIKDVHEEWWDTFQGVLKWQEDLIKFYHEYGYVESLSGHRRRAPISINKLINAPIQADEADIIFDAFNRLSEMNEEEYQPILEIHDDLSNIIKVENKDKYVERVVFEMTKISFGWVNTPLTVEISTGPAWDQLTKPTTYDSISVHGLPHRPNYSY